MFEFDQYQRALRRRTAEPPPAAYRPASDITELSFLWWSEHCVECADPDCYTSCALFEARPDGRCRRFAYGIFRNRRYRSLRGYGAEVAFKRWGKLEAHGNVWMEPAAVVLRRERALALKRRLARTVGSLAARISADPRWRPDPPEPRKIARRLHRQGPPARWPEAFLLEVYNPGAAPVDLQVSMRCVETPDCVTAVPPLLTTLRLPPGYSRHRIERARFEAIAAAGRPFKVALLPAGDEAVRLVFLTCDFVIEGGPEAAAPEVANPVKCVVFDLDDTLWTGVLLHGDRPRLRPGVERVLRELDRRGILLSLASKNDHAAALAHLTATGLADLFLHPEIGWGPKSIAIARIAGRLNLGLDAFAFVDDTPFERAEVAAAHPGVACLDAAEVESLLEDARFRGSDSADAGRRREFYRDEIARTAELQQSGEDHLTFLRSCDIELSIKALTPADLDRAVELIQRTNQLNFSARRYGRNEILDLVRDPRLSICVMTCRDRFGDYGTIGVVVAAVDGPTLRIEDFMLSCRVQGRGIEQAVFAHLVASARPRPERIWVRFRPTPRNVPARRALEDLGFAFETRGARACAAAGGADDAGFVLDLTRHDLLSDVIRVSAHDGMDPAAPVPPAAAVA